MIGWATKPLGELCEVLDRYRKPITKSDRREGPYPYYGAMGVVDYVNGYLFDEPLILLGEDGAKWGSGELCAFKAAGKYWVNNHAHIMRPDRTQVLDDWLVYYLCGTDLLPFITGLTVPKLNQERMREIPIPVPPLKEQRRILAFLDEAFAVIATATANTEKNLANARELFEEKLRSAFNHAEAGWIETQLGKVCIFENGDRGSNYPNRAEYVESGVPWINTGHIEPDGTLSTSRMNYITKEKFESLRSGKIKAGDLVYCLRGATLGKTAIVSPLAEGAVASSLVIVRPREGIDKRFTYYFLTSPFGQQQIRGFENGAAQPNLGAKSVAKFKIFLPPLAQQRLLVDRLDEIRSECQALEMTYFAKLSSLSALKKSLLHRAFTGELTATPRELVTA